MKGCRILPSGPAAGASSRPRALAATSASVDGHYSQRVPGPTRTDQGIARSGTTNSRCEGFVTLTTQTSADNLTRDCSRRRVQADGGAGTEPLNMSDRDSIQSLLSLRKLTRA